MAEAIARHLAPDLIEPCSAGLAAVGRVMPETLAVLRESGIACAGLASKPIGSVNWRALDLIVNLSGYPLDKFFDAAGLPVEDWVVGDPYGSDLAVYRHIRDEIQRRVVALIERLRTGQSRAGAPA